MENNNASTISIVLLALHRISHSRLIINISFPALKDNQYLGIR